VDRSYEIPAGSPDAPLNPAELRSPYAGEPLTEDTVAASPVEQFAAWIADAVRAGVPEANAMVLATAGADGFPDARTVLLKGYGPEGFVFYTNYTSRKGAELAENPRAALVFPWHAIRRQVRVRGTVERLGSADSAAYFHSRPYGSQLGAWASERQSAVIPDRGILRTRFAELAGRWPEGTTVPLPDFWGGFRVVPAEIEFWQGGADRLHDRLRYRPDTGEAWTIERLAP
jgi:pyridoxamine 5'-phosphate oxidase